ncbi:MAG: hypothetical protein PUA84_03280 [Oscillospiraceae bacterium]|nr:hypothetical protein [Oscillospiraceae bacterium]
MIFSNIAINAQYVSAENEIFPETLTITEKNYTGRLINSYNIDIDGDGIKEKIGRYHIDKIDYSASDFYYTYNDDSEPYIMFKEPSNDHVYINVHIIQDNNTGETFFGYSYGDISANESLHKLYLDGQDKLIIGFNGGEYQNGEMAEYEQYLEYMQNVTFLDQTAYGKGDVDGDADITLSDADIILSCYADNAAGLPSEINEIQSNAADMDKDGEITINDASTALSLYSEHAAGIIDTLILPPTVKKDYFYAGEPHELYSGDLESVFYLDIDSDGKKETIGRYDNTNFDPYKNTTNVVWQYDPYVLQVYDNGKFYDTFGLNEAGSTSHYTYFLIEDHNINETYLACISHRIRAMYSYAGVGREYPDVSQSEILSASGIVETTNGAPVFKIENISKNGISATKQEVLDYIANLEIISPYADEADELSVFEYIFDTYGE